MNNTVNNLIGDFESKIGKRECGDNLYAVLASVEYQLDITNT